jgi:hypothetical protein
MARTWRALAQLADQARSGAEMAMASVDDMLLFVNASNKRIDAMEAAHQAAIAALRRSSGNAHPSVDTQAGVNDH